MRKLGRKTALRIVFIGSDLYAFEAQLGGWREIHGILPFDIHLRQQLFLNNVCEH